MKFQSSKTVWFTIMQYKNCEFFYKFAKCRNSINIENQAVATKKVTKQSQMKWKALHFLLVCVNENFKNQSLIYV